MSIKLHQDVYDRKAGETVAEADLPDGAADWLLGNGYASREGEERTRATGVEVDKDQTNPDVRGAAEYTPRQDKAGAVAEPDRPAQTPEAFDPSTRSVSEVEDYLEQASGLERDRVLRAEAQGKARKSLVGDQSDEG